MSIQPFLFGEDWIAVRDGNDTARALFDRHYSRYFYKDGRKPKLFVGPGEKLVLLVWRKFISGDHQEGINCAIFRNEGDQLSSRLIQKADAIADARWPGERHYTYVNPKAIRGSNPGCCFKAAGWTFCGLTKRGLHVLQRRGQA